MYKQWHNNVASHKHYSTQRNQVHQGDFKMNTNYHTKFQEHCRQTVLAVNSNFKTTVIIRLSTNNKFMQIHRTSEINRLASKCLNNPAER